MTTKFHLPRACRSLSGPAARQDRPRSASSLSSIAQIATRQQMISGATYNVTFGYDVSCEYPAPIAVVVTCMPGTWPAPVPHSMPMPALPSPMPSMPSMPMGPVCFQPAPVNWFPQWGETCGAKSGGFDGTQPSGFDLQPCWVEPKPTETSEPEPEDSTTPSGSASSDVSERPVDQAGEIMKSLGILKDSTSCDPQRGAPCTSEDGGNKNAGAKICSTAKPILLSTYPSTAWGRAKGQEILQLLHTETPDKDINHCQDQDLGKHSKEHFEVQSSRTWSDGQRKRSRSKRHCCNIVLYMPRDYVPAIIGKGGCYTKAIYESTGCKVRVRGRGSGHLEQSTQAEAPTPLMLAVTAEHDNMEGFVEAVRLSFSHLAAVEQRFLADYQCEAGWENSCFSAVVEDDEDREELTRRLSRTFLKLISKP
ncbi:unnamed protein product [Effrenium voratum]|nr:unnamed protein product [Effrenium voratum]